MPAILKREIGLRLPGSVHAFVRHSSWVQGNGIGLGSVVAQIGTNSHTGVILKDFAGTATVSVNVHIRCALDPSQAQDDPIVRWGNSLSDVRGR